MIGDYDEDDERDMYWTCEPEPTKHDRHTTIANGAKSLLLRLGPAPVHASSGSAYREHLTNPPAMPDGSHCACPACERLILLCQTLPFEEAITETVRVETGRR